MDNFTDAAPSFDRVVSKERQMRGIDLAQEISIRERSHRFDSTPTESIRQCEWPEGADFRALTIS